MSEKKTSHRPTTGLSTPTSPRGVLQRDRLGNEAKRSNRHDPSTRQVDTPKALSAAGLRATPARLAVLQVLQAAQRPMSHADLEATLAAPLDRVTLYRTLDSFVEAGLASRTVGDDRVSRFSAIDTTVNHHSHAHFQCDDCGRTFCLPTKPPRSAALPEGFELTSTELSFHGHCADCQTSHR